MKNLNQSVMSRLKIVAVALIEAGTPNPTYNVVMVISGSPTSKGMPTGMDFTATTMAPVIRITLQETGSRSDKKTKYETLMLKNQLSRRKNNEMPSVLGLCLNSFIPL